MNDCGFPTSGKLGLRLVLLAVLSCWRSNIDFFSSESFWAVCLRSTCSFEALVTHRSAEGLLRWSLSLFVSNNICVAYFRYHKRYYPRGFLRNENTSGRNLFAGFVETFLHSVVNTGAVHWVVTFRMCLCCRAAAVTCPWIEVNRSAAKYVFCVLKRWAEVSGSTPSGYFSWTIWALADAPEKLWSGTTAKKLFTGLKVLSREWI